MKFSRQKLATHALIASIIFTQTGCGTFTGIPAHGGGKRFSQEQRIVSASARSTIEKIDVSALYGRKVAVVYDFISDEGGGTLSGGRFNLIASALSTYAMSPVTSSVGQWYSPKI